MNGLTAYALATAPKAKKIVFIGDSITAGDMNVTRSYPFLFDSFTGHLHTIINRGVGGNQTSTLIDRFTIDVLDFNPDVCHINIGRNDITAGVSASVTQANIIEMVRRCEFAGIAPILSTVIQYATGHAEPDKAAKTVALNEWIREFARLSGIKYIDYYSAFLGSDNNSKSELMGDQIHPNKKGMHVMASELMKYFDSRPVEKMPIIGTNLVPNSNFDDANLDGIPNGYSVGSATGVTLEKAIIETTHGRAFKMKSTSASTNNTSAAITTTVSGWQVGDTLRFSLDVMLTEIDTDITSDHGFSARIITYGTSRFFYALHYCPTKFGKFANFQTEFTVPVGVTAIEFNAVMFNVLKGTAYIRRPRVIKIG